MDKSIEYTVKIPTMWKKRISDKYQIEEKDIQPFIHEEIKSQKSKGKKQGQLSEIDLNFKAYLQQRQSIV